MRRRLLLASAAITLHGASLAGPPADKGELNDLMARFWPLYDESLALPGHERAAFLTQRFFAPEQALYARAGIGTVDATVVQRWLTSFDEMAAAVRETHARFARDFQQVRSALRTALPDFDAASSPVYLIPSLFWFDGHLEADGKTLPLFFGLDGIVHHHGTDTDLSVLISHELYHCYQGQGNPQMMLQAAPPVYAMLWLEGTAVYASERLNPSAPLQHVLLNQQALLRDGPPMARRVAAELTKRLDSTRRADIGAFFSLGAKEAWPEMAGYYVGLLCARDIGRSMTLRDMAFLPTERVRELVAQALARIVQS